MERGRTETKVEECLRLYQRQELARLMVTAQELCTGGLHKCGILALGSFLRYMYFATKRAVCVLTHIYIHHDFVTRTDT